MELVRYQKKKLPVAAGMEEVICSAEKILRSERIKGLLCLPHSYNKLMLSFMIFCLTEWFKKFKHTICSL